MGLWLIKGLEEGDIIGGDILDSRLDPEAIEEFRITCLQDQ